MNKVQSAGLIIVIVVNNMLGHDDGNTLLIPLIAANAVGMVCMFLGADK